MRVRTGICGILLACIFGAVVAHFKYSRETTASLERYQEEMGYAHEDGVEALIPRGGLFPVEEATFDKDGNGVVDERSVIAWRGEDYEFRWVLKEEEDPDRGEWLSLTTGLGSNRAIMGLMNLDSAGNPQRVSFRFPEAGGKEGFYTIYYDQDSDGRLDMRSRFADAECSSISVMYKNTWRIVLARDGDCSEIELDEGKTQKVVFKDGEWKEAQK